MRDEETAQSTLTDRYQTTVPEPVRRALKLAKRDRIRYVVRPDGGVEMRRAADAEEPDPVLERFLDLLACDMAERPERLRAVDPDLARRMQDLVGDVEVDLDQPLPDDRDA